MSAIAEGAASHLLKLLEVTSPNSHISYNLYGQSYLLLNKMNNSHISYTKNLNLSHPLLPKKLISHISYNSKLCGSHIFVSKFENNTKISYFFNETFFIFLLLSTFIGVMNKPTNNPPSCPSTIVENLASVKFTKFFWRTDICKVP